MDQLLYLLFSNLIDFIDNKMTEIKDINCAFSYISSAIFLIGIIIYIYLLVVDSREEGERSNSDTVWIWGMFVLLITGFLISSYCIYGVTKEEALREKWKVRNFSTSVRNPFNFLGKKMRPNITSKMTPPIVRDR